MLVFSLVTLLKKKENEGLSEDSPLEIKANGFVTIQEDRTNYFDFNMLSSTNNCSLFSYHIDSNNEVKSIFLPISSNPKYTKNENISDFSSFKEMKNGTYSFSLYSYGKTKLFVYSSCFTGTGNISILNLEKTYNSSNIIQFFKYDLKHSKTFVISNDDNIDYIQVLNSDFSSKIKVRDFNKKIILSRGLYYFVVKKNNNSLNSSFRLIEN